MSEIRSQNGVRDLRDGDWYWIDRKVLRLYGRRLGPSGLAIYNALAFFAGSETQQCFPTQRVVAQLLGLSRRTVLRRIKLLKELGLVRVERNRNSCLYMLLEPRAAVSKETSGHDGEDTPEVTAGSTNNNQLTRDINNNDSKKIFASKPKAYNVFKPKSREELLALDLAEGLNDRQGLARYLSLARRYPESLLRRILSQVKAVPDGKIRKGRAALFNYLIQKYAQEGYKNLRDQPRH